MFVIIASSGQIGNSELCETQWLQPERPQVLNSCIRLEAMRFNLISGILRLLRYNRGLWYFLIATSAMSHSLMLA
jgi:hypothetical protein